LFTSLASADSGSLRASLAASADLHRSAFVIEDALTLSLRVTQRAGAFTISRANHV
jgi:hypothetical protein